MNINCSGFYDSKGIRLNGTKHLNNTFHHISINGFEDIDIENLQIIARADNQNIVGIDISSSIHINIHDCYSNWYEIYSH